MNITYTTACKAAIDEAMAQAALWGDDWRPSVIIVDQEHYDGLVREWEQSLAACPWLASECVKDDTMPGTFMGCAIYLSPTVTGVEVGG